MYNATLAALALTFIFFLSFTPTPRATESTNKEVQATVSSHPFGPAIEDNATNNLAEATTRKKITISYSPEVPCHRLMLDHIQAAYRRIGFRTEFIPLPLNRALMSSNEGLVDADLGRVSSIEKEFTNLRRVNVKLKDIHGVACTNHDEIVSYNNELLTRYRFGYVFGVQWSQKILENMNNKVAVHSPNALFLAMLNDRVDIVLVSEVTGQTQLNLLEKKANEIHCLNPPVFTTPLYHYVHKRHHQIIPLLEKALRELNNEQKLQAGK